ncbi:MAG: hypothetical protein JWQ73_274 [Variovorax sp.]|nr:hypothetical protein [Variovorax sp.]
MPKLKLPDRFFAEHVVVLQGQAGGDVVLLKWVNGKLVVVKVPIGPDPRLVDLSRAIGVIGAAANFHGEVANQVAHALQFTVEQGLEHAMEGMSLPGRA